MYLIFILFFILVFFIIVKPYFIKYDNLVSFTGGLGSGKSFMSVQTALVLYRKQRLRVRVYNFFHPRDRQPLPELYANIPVRINRRKMAIRLTKEHLLLQDKIVPRSVTLLDEVDCFANQWQHDNPCIVNKRGGDENGNFDEFCRFYRQYTKGGYLIFNTQATANENLVIRRRQNTVITLFNFRKYGIPLIWPAIFYTVKARNKTLSDDVTTIEEGNTEDNMRIMFGFFPLTRHYDTYCYSGRYESVPSLPQRRFKGLKTNECLIAPLGRQPKHTTNTDEPPEVDASETDDSSAAAVTSIVPELTIVASSDASNQS